MNEAAYVFDSPLDNFLDEDNGEIESRCSYLDLDPNDNLICNFDNEAFVSMMEPISQLPVIQEDVSVKPIKIKTTPPKMQQKKAATKKMSFTYKHAQTAHKITNMMATRHKLSEKYNLGNSHHRMIPRNQSVSIREVPRICTPEWYQADISHGDFISPHQLPSYIHKKNCEAFDRVGSHQILEICEARIREGFNKKFSHPAMAKQLIEDGFAIVMTHKEYIKSNNYIQEQNLNKIPSFWPSRMWDSPINTMCSQEVDELTVRLTEILEDNGVSLIPETQNEPPKKKRGRKPRVRATIELSIDNFATEPEDDTEWDEL